MSKITSEDELMEIWLKNRSNRELVGLLMILAELPNVGSFIKKLPELEKILGMRGMSE